MNAENAMKLIKEIDPDIPEKGIKSLFKVMEEDIGLGIAFSILGCGYCGEEWLLIYAIPTDFPKKCPICHNSQSYKISELSL